MNYVRILVLLDNATFTCRDTLCDPVHGHRCLISTTSETLPWKNVSMAPTEQPVRFLFSYTLSICKFYRGEKHCYRVNGKDKEPGTAVRHLTRVGHIITEVWASNISSDGIFFACGDGCSLLSIDMYIWMCATSLHLMQSHFAGV